MALANRDAVELHRAFEGFGCDAAAVIRILAHRNSCQRLQIRQVYKNIFDEDLCDRIKREVGGDLRKAMLLWMCSPAERDASILKAVLRSPLVNATKRNKVLVETLWIKSKEEVDAISSAFACLDGHSLFSAIQATVKNEKCRELFLRYLLSKGSCGNTITVHTGCNTDTEFKEMLETLKECVNYRAHYFAKVLYKSMKGLGTDDDTLIRVVVSRSEVDMTQIKSAFFESYRVSLHSMITSDTKGDYRAFLLALIGSGC